MNAARLIGLFKKPATKKIINIETAGDTFAFSDDDKLLVFYEYVGEGPIDINIIDGTQRMYPNTDLFLIIDDTYEGLLTDTELEIINQIKGWKEILVCTSNEKLCGPNVLHLNFHLYNPKYDNIVVQDHKEKDIFLNRSKKFICLNRQERLHRLLTMDFLIEHDLIKHSHASCEYDEFRIVVQGMSKIEKINWQGRQTADNFYKNRMYGAFEELKSFSASKEQKTRLNSSLPIVLDKPLRQLNPNELPCTEEYFNDAYWALVTERDFYRSSNYLGWTEKVLKCMIYKNPFLVIGLPHTLKSLQNKGFLTFSKYIDEGYDLIEDDDLRFESVCEQIKYLGSLNYAELDSMHRDMKNILDYNYDHYKKLNNEIPYNLINRMQLWFRDKP